MDISKYNHGDYINAPYNFCLKYSYIYIFFLNNKKRNNTALVSSTFQTLQALLAKQTYAESTEAYINLTQHHSYAMTVFQLQVKHQCLQTHAQFYKKN